RCPRNGKQAAVPGRRRNLIATGHRVRVRECVPGRRGADACQPGYRPWVARCAGRSVRDARDPHRIDWPSRGDAGLTGARMHARPPQPARSNVLRAAFPATLCAALVAIAPVAARAQSAETLALSRTAADDEVAATMPGIVVTATRSPEPAADLVADVTVLEG